MSSDEELMLAFQKGSTEGFTELFQRYAQRLYGFFRRRLENPTRAEELTQDVFVAVLKATARWEPRALFRTYLYSIAVRMLMAERRKAYREVADAGQAPEPSQAAQSETAVWVRDALGRLEETEREILLLREYEELSYEEIAQVLSIPVNTVKSRLYRARMALRELLVARQPRGGTA
ncbi:MAG TPA: sigma-70 family RNA polymerase sigma factor [Candidatus Acidoferrales bacterium]|nr:sigma-70 family RNA polymerase sigma factor [Candidatus Acidoferrales bacterium]